MVDPVTARRWGFRALYVTLAATVIFVQILPLDVGRERWPGPDILLLTTFAWVLRRPEYVPLGLIAVVALLADLLLMRPPGLWTALTILASEFLRARGHLSSELPFPVEWLLVSGMLVAMGLGNGVAFAVLMVPLPGFAQISMQVAASILAYPLMVALSAYALGVRPPIPGAEVQGV